MANNELPVVQHQKFSSGVEIRTPASIKGVVDLVSTESDELIKVDTSGNIAKSGKKASDIKTESEINALIDSKIEQLDWQKDVLDIQVDNTLDPGATPTAGDRYIITDKDNLHANFGTITGIGNGDIVEYVGSAFVVVYDVSVQGEGAFVWNRADNGLYQYNGTSWAIRPINTYTADESTLTLSGGQFSIKNGGVGATQLGSGAATFVKLGADAKPKEVTFADTDFTTSGSDKVLSIAAATHGLGTDNKLDVSVYMDNGSSAFKKTAAAAVVASNGDISLTVPSGAQFTGKLIVHKSA